MERRILFLRGVSIIGASVSAGLHTAMIASRKIEQTVITVASSKLANQALNDWGRTKKPKFALSNITVPTVTIPSIRDREEQRKKKFYHKFYKMPR